MMVSVFICSGYIIIYEKGYVVITIYFLFLLFFILLFFCFTVADNMTSVYFKIFLKEKITIKLLRI